MTVLFSSERICAGSTRSAGTSRIGHVLLLAVVLVFAAVSLATALETAVHVVSQRGRAFLPGQMTISRGETIEIVNDDGDLLHHAYVDAEGFSFDSGDQQPGSKTDVVFTKAGTFKVLCGIHPKMKLIVTVKD